MPELYEELGLTTGEYEAICVLQEREPTHVELAVFSLMWSEHCGYKHSRPLLTRFPTTGERVLQGPGENAGIVDVGDGLAIAMKMESHNHPSAVEPYQGAATGVGGIVRDIFTMGARPICNLNSLRFGEITPEATAPAATRAGAAAAVPGGATEPACPAGADPTAAGACDFERQRYLCEHVVEGIGGYGNCMGIPTVAGELYFEEAYSGNCLVNAMTVGLMRHDQIVRSVASGVGNHVVLMGNKTGRDGIGGASVLASQEFDETLEEKRPSVQVGDPFTEKKLLECCLELLHAGRFVALQDLGAAGITSSSSEMAAKGGVGLDLHVDRVLLREADMAPWEIMVSESQERMLGIVRDEELPAVFEACDRWDLDCTVVGVVTDTGRLRVFHHGEMVGDMSAEALAEGPTYTVVQERPAHESDLPVDPAVFPRPGAPLDAVLLDLLASPNIASRQWVWRQYDHQVQLNTVVLPGGDAAVLRLKRSGAGVALCTDGNGRHSFLDPYRGGKAAVAEAARNVSCTGARPIAITNCLNFGNPEKGPIMWQFAHTIEGMAEACEALDCAVISGNVSFYNESFGAPIYPTPVVGMLGLMDDVTKARGCGFCKDGGMVFLLGDTTPVLDGSEYQKRWFGKVEGRIPDVDLAAEVALQRALRRGIDEGLVSSAHDLSDGGLAVAFAECCMAGGRGARVTLDGVAGAERAANRLDVALFGEAPTRALVEAAAEHAEAFRALCATEGVPCTIVGAVGGGTLAFETEEGLVDVPVAALSAAYEGGLARALGEEEAADS